MPPPRWDTGSSPRHQQVALLAQPCQLLGVASRAGALTSGSDNNLGRAPLPSGRLRWMHVGAWPGPEARWPESPGGDFLTVLLPWLCQCSRVSLLISLGCPLGSCLIALSLGSSVLLSQSPLLLSPVAPWCSWFLSQRLITRFPRGGSGEGRVRVGRRMFPISVPAPPSWGFSSPGQARTWVMNLIKGVPPPRARPGLPLASSPGLTSLLAVGTRA